MKTKKTKFCLEIDSYERSIFLNSLNTMRTDLQQQGKMTDSIDELILKVGKAPPKRFRLSENPATGGNRDEAR